MSQTAYNNFPEVAREGFIADTTRVRDIVSRIAEAEIKFGKLVVATTGQSEDLAKVPAATGDISTLGLVHGIAIADPSIETPKGATYGSYATDKAVPVMRKGRIWVLAEDEVTDLDKAVFVRHATPGATGLGSFRTDADGGDATAFTKARWRSRTVGTLQLAILEIDL